MTRQTTPFELTVEENGANHSLNVIVLQKRIAELETALKRIEDTDPDEGTPWFHEVARAALGEKE